MPKKVSLDVQLLDFTENALALIYAACRQCYSPQSAAGILSEGEKDPAKMSQFVKKVVSSGHESPIEHAKFTFAIQGVSRALSHQLVRHRVASYSQQSQRYVKENDFDYVTPPSVSSDPVLSEIFLKTMNDIQDSYNRMISRYQELGNVGEKANQDARFVLPQAAETKIVVTMNCRELKHFFSHRCCARAQWEIKAMADKMLAICRKKLPEVFDGSGAKCEGLGFCPEGSKFSCGRFPAKEDILKEAK